MGHFVILVKDGHSVWHSSNHESFYFIELSNEFKENVGRSGTQLLFAVVGCLSIDEQSGEHYIKHSPSASLSVHLYLNHPQC